MSNIKGRAIWSSLGQLLEVVWYERTRDIDLSGADLRGADLSGAYFRGASVIDAGQDSRGYRFVGIQQEEGYRIAAGCRWLNLEKAQAHWANNAEATGKIEMIEREAKRRNW
ncbi:pentapeptide repeats [Bacteriophage sp.]|nr:pentapeptide repeats [Bacteriophage sp.]